MAATIDTAKPGSNVLTPCLLFPDFDADAAVSHYLSIFPDGKVHRTSRYGDAVPSLKGKSMLIEFEIAGQRFQALNGGPPAKFNEAISLSVTTDTQAETDRLWARLTEGGAEIQCGWLRDRFGVSWQIVPREFIEMVTDPDPARSKRAFAAMVQMKKLDVAVLRKAWAGES